MAATGYATHDMQHPGVIHVKVVAGPTRPGASLRLARRSAAPHRAWRAAGLEDQAMDGSTREAATKAGDARAPRERLPWPVALRVIAILALAFWLLIAWALSAAWAANPCAVALMLAIDVSGSVSAQHYAMQRDATAEALRSAPVLRAARDGLRTAVMMWGSAQHLAVGFSDDPIGTADRLLPIARPEAGATDIAGAIRAAAVALLAEPCERRVLDLSGDGAHNAGPLAELEAAVAEAAAAGIEINALPIVTPVEPDIGDWYRTHVTGPAGGFAIEAAPEAFARAIRAKLAMEIASR
jgi:Ca-activated chloride channel family protein